MTTARLDARRARGLPLALVAIAAACQVGPRDAFVTGESALAAGDLLAALRSFDEVPITDLRYPSARLGAAALERRLRRQKEMQLLGLRLRSEWRDDEALAAFRSALEAWPGNEETAAMIAATEARRRTMAPIQGEAEAGADVPGMQSRKLDDPAAAPPKVVGALPGPGGPAARAGAGAAATTNDAARTELARIEARLSAGELEKVLTDLVALQRAFPDDATVGNRLARLLQQRGLMRYGQGNVAAALTDWQRALDLDPSLHTARVLFDLATAELAAPPR